MQQAREIKDAAASRAVQKDLDKYISYYRAAKGAPPERVLVSVVQHNRLGKPDEYKGIPLVRHG